MEPSRKMVRDYLQDHVVTGQGLELFLSERVGLE